MSRIGMERNSMLDSFLFSNNERTKNTIKGRKFFSRESIYSKDKTDLKENKGCNEEKVRHWPYPKSVRILLPEGKNVDKNAKNPNSFNAKKTQSLENATYNRKMSSVHESYHNFLAEKKENATLPKRYLPKILHSFLNPSQAERPKNILSIPVHQVLPKRLDNPSRTLFTKTSLKEPIKIKSSEPVLDKTQAKDRHTLKKRSSAPYVRESITIIDRDRKKSAPYSSLEMKALMASRFFSKKDKDVQLLQSKRKPSISSPGTRPSVYPPNAVAGAAENVNPPRDKQPPNFRRPGYVRGQGSRDVHSSPPKDRVRFAAKDSSSETISKGSWNEVSTRKSQSPTRKQPTASVSTTRKEEYSEDIRIKNLRPVQLSPHTIEYLPLDLAKLQTNSENILEKLKKKDKKEKQQKE
ncbi:uncharacterized protein LOC106668310 [Cimex lectularius]|uniref:Uncharacterized protein n=1 Tax=Cimex lectularius TaxID=79782 RepID=A0A8I6RYL8_CIMLE|nr:uncharacterized protein LOC106668310 [Cimex lectularius]